MPARARRAHAHLASSPPLGAVARRVIGEEGEGERAILRGGAAAAARRARARTHARTRTRMRLAAIHPLPGDELISFDPRGHHYTVNGKAVPISVTALGARAVPPEHKFNGREVILKNLASWRANASSKYHAYVVGVTDRQAIDAVFAEWSKTTKLGTAMHLCIEQALNDEPVTREDEFAVELAQWRVIMNTELSDLTPYRTELSIFATDANGDAAVAGQIDLLAVDNDGDFHLVDWKRTTNDISADAFSYGKYFLDGKPLNDHSKYSLQLSLYAVIFEQQTGRRIHSATIVQIHPDLAEARAIPASDLRKDAKKLLKSVGVVFR